MNRTDGGDMTQTKNIPRHTTEKRIAQSPRWHGSSFLLVLTTTTIIVMLACHCDCTPTTALPSTSTMSANQKEDADEVATNSIRLRALHTIRRSLETYGDLTAKRLMLHMALKTNEVDHRLQNPSSADQLFSRDSSAGSRSSEEVASKYGQIDPPESSAQVSSNKAGAGNSSERMDNGAGFLRVRVGLKETHWEKEANETEDEAKPLQEETASTSSALDTEHDQQADGTRRQLRSTALHRRQQQELASTHFAHHRRRRKGCPPMHGKDQLLCPSRNTHRYDVCITREKLCDHNSDCPNGEDEDPKHCFFYKPLDDQLKTLSHAVLLLVDSVMSEHQQQRRNEL